MPFRNDCSNCQALAIIGDRAKGNTGGPVAERTHCSQCMREVSLTIDRALLDDPLYRDAVFNYGRLIAEDRGFPVTLFSFLLDGEEFLADPDCECCAECDHERMEIEFDSLKLEPLKKAE